MLNNLSTINKNKQKNSNWRIPPVPSIYLFGTELTTTNTNKKTIQFFFCFFLYNLFIFWKQSQINSVIKLTTTTKKMLFLLNQDQEELRNIFFWCVFRRNKKKKILIKKKKKRNKPLHRLFSSSFFETTIYLFVVVHYILVFCL